MNFPSVLVCDDEPMIGASIRRALEPHGIDVLIDTSSDALHLAQFFQPKVILIDLMQWRDGLAMLQELKTDPETAQIPVAIISGAFAEGDDPQEVCPGASALGAFAIIPKPVPLDFIDALAAYVKGGPLPVAAPVEIELQIDDRPYEFDCELEVDFSDAA